MLSIRTDMTGHKMLNNQRINSDLYQRNMEKLSSGLRINSAKDDSAGLSISERLKSQINESNQRIRNDKMQQSFYQTADGVLSSISDQLQRLRELTIQSQNGALSANDKDMLQTEANQILNSIENMGQTATFNDIKIFDESEMKLEPDNNMIKGFSSGLWNLNPETSVIDDETLKFNKISSGYGINKYIDLSVTPNQTYSGKLTVENINITGTNPGAYFEVYVKNPDNSYTKYAQTSVSINGALSFNFTVPNNVNTIRMQTATGFFTYGEFYLKSPELAPSDSFHLVDVQTGLKSISLLELSVDNLNIQELNSLVNIDNAIEKISENRSFIGSKLNQLDFNIQNESNKVINQSQSKSRLSDTDFGQTSSELLKNDLKIQSSISMLKKNEQNQQNVLQLFRG